MVLGAALVVKNGPPNDSAVLAVKGGPPNGSAAQDSRFLRTACSIAGCGYSMKCAVKAVVLEVSCSRPEGALHAPQR